MSIYRWKEGVRVSLAAQIVGERLEEVRSTYGGLTKQVVVEDAKSKNSPLHSYFEWDDKKAATSYRENQAGELIRWLGVIVEKPDGEEVLTRAFVSVIEQDERGYTSVAHAMSDNALRKQVLMNAWNELSSFKKKYEEYEELSSVFNAMDTYGKKHLNG